MPPQQASKCNTPYHQRFASGYGTPSWSIATRTQLHTATAGTRSMYATWLVSAGVPINDVSAVMGHEQTSTTLDRYTHPSQDRDQRSGQYLLTFC
jgi:integrase